MSAVVAVVASQLSASASTSQSDCNRPSNFVNKHTSTTWCACRHLHRADLCSFARHWPWPTRKWFSRDYV